MRLGQLSRKLEVDSSTIVKLLQKNFREVNNHPNVKISEEELEFLTQHFAPAQEAEEEVKEQEAESSEESSPIVEEITEAPPIDEKPDFVESLRPKVITLEEEFNEKKKELESFKAEKPELEGLRVVGKIDLPEPKPKAAKETKEEQKPEGTQTINERGVRQRHNKKKDNRRSSNRNPVESERKRAEYQAKKKKEQEKEWQKEQKRKHYEENIKAKIADKPKKRNRKKYIQQQVGQEQATHQNKGAAKASNPLVRFWRWLNGDYDKFD